jgi:hypothetical protein
MRMRPAYAAASTAVGVRDDDGGSSGEAVVVGPEKAADGAASACKAIDDDDGCVAVALSADAVNSPDIGKKSKGLSLRGRERDVTSTSSPNQTRQLATVNKLTNTATTTGQQTRASDDHQQGAQQQQQQH